MFESPVKAPQSPSITRTLEELPAHACNNCGTTTTHQCSASHPNTSSTGGCPVFAFYCGDTCQKHDSKEHHEECEQLEARNKLFAIARTIRDCWLTVRQNTWNHDIQRMKIDETEISGRVVCDIGSGEKFDEGTIFHKFDKNVVEGLHTKYGVVTDAVLTAGTSEHAIACLFKLVKYLLQDLYIKIEEVQISPGVPLLMVQDLEANNHTNSTTKFKYNKNHWVYKITATTGKEYALDVTGAQFGDDCALCPWELINVTGEHRLFGETHTRLHNILDTHFISLEQAYCEVNWTHLCCALDIFVRNLHDKKFQGPIRREDLVSTLDKYLKDTLPVDPIGDFKEWVNLHCAAPTPLAKMLSRMVPGVVPLGVEVREEIQIHMPEVEVGKQPELEDEYERYQREGHVKCVIL